MTEPATVPTVPDPLPGAEPPPILDPTLPPEDGEGGQGGEGGAPYDGGDIPPTS